MILEKVGINPDKQNTLIQNLKQVRNFQNRQITLLSMDGKIVYSGKYSNIPNKYFHCKVKSINKSLGKSKVLAYLLLNNGNDKTGIEYDTGHKAKYLNTYKGYDIYKMSFKGKSDYPNAKPYLIMPKGTPLNLKTAIHFYSVSGLKNYIENNKRR